MARVLYITYDSLMEPLGMSQVWQYRVHLQGSYFLYLEGGSRRPFLMKIYG